MKDRKPTFRLRVDRESFSELLDKYQGNQKEMEKELASIEAGKRIVEGERSLKNLRPIIEWKSPRSKGRVEGNSPEDVADALRLACSAKTERTAMAVLTGLRGVQVPVASAILTVMYPKKFTVIDFRALESLDTQQLMPTVDYYLDYLRFCRHKASAFGLSLRQFDQILWQASKSKKFNGALDAKA